MRAKINKQNFIPRVQIVDQNGLWVEITLPDDLLDVVFEAHQPDMWDENVFNTLIVNVDSGRSFAIRSKDLEFLNEPKPYQLQVTRTTTQSVLMLTYAHDYETARIQLMANAQNFCWGNIPENTTITIEKP